jgi:hypothetical protein
VQQTANQVYAVLAAEHVPADTPVENAEPTGRP